MNFTILTDSTSDLNKELREQYNIDYVTMNYVLDGVEYPASLDWESHSPKEFYDLMRQGKRITTTQVPRELFYDKFSASLKDGKDVVYIACSSALSGSYNLATVVARELADEYPNNKVYCVDSLISSLGQGSIVIKAATLRAEGKTAAETAEYIEANRLKYNQFGTADTLEYLSRAGRIKASKAFFGNLFGVKPIIISDVLGQNYAYKKTKGSLNSKIAIADDIAAAVKNSEEQILYITHGDDITSAEQLKELILERAAFKDVHIGHIGPIVGSCVGPGTIIAFCYGNEVTIKGE